MSYQFIHLEAYSRKTDKGGRSVRWVLDEADRKPSATLHVENPEPPKVVHGCSIAKLRDTHDEACENTKTINRDGNSKAIRVDQKTLLTVVASHEMTPGEYRSDVRYQMAYERWEQDTVQWLRDQYGDDLRSVVRHQDEGRLHIHAYVLPSDLKALERHPGVHAKRAAKADAIARGMDAKEANKVGDKAYQDAMRGWQDSYFEKVGVRHGLARLGPGKRRLSREEWRSEQAAAKALQLARERAERVVEQGDAYIAETKEKASLVVSRAASAKVEAAKIMAAALAKAEAAKLQHDEALREQQKARDMLCRARAEASRIVGAARDHASSIGSKVRGLWDGLRKSSIREKARKEFQGQIDAAKDVAADVRLEMRAERDRRRKAEIRANNISASQERSVRAAFQPKMGFWPGRQHSERFKGPNGRSF